MTIDDQVEIRCSRFNSEKMENIEDWRVGRVVSVDDFSFQLEFMDGRGSESETFPMSILEQGDARLIPIKTFSSMFYE